MKHLRLLLKIIDRISEWSGKFASFTILLMIVSIVWDVVLRYGLNAKPFWGFGSYKNLLLSYIVFGASYTLLCKGHVNVDFFYQRFSVRVKAAVDALTAVFFFLYCLVLIVHCASQAIEQQTGLKVSAEMFFPAYWPIVSMAVAGLVFLFLQGLAKFIRDITIVIAGRKIL